VDGYSLNQSAVVEVEGVVLVAAAHRVAVEHPAVALVPAEARRAEQPRLAVQLLRELRLQE